MKPPNCTAKEFFVIKENCSVQNASKAIKSIINAEYNKVNCNYEPESSNIKNPF